MKLTAAIAFALLPLAPLRAQELCRPPNDVDYGIQALRCTGPTAACAIYVHDDSSAVHHRFSVEPVIAAVTNTSSGLEVGDVVVAVDRLLITTEAAGAHLVRVAPGQISAFLVRRAGDLITIPVTATRGCGLRRLTVGRGDD